MIHTLDGAPAPAPGRPPRRGLRDAPVQARLAVGLLWLGLLVDVSAYVVANVLQPVAIQPIPGLVSDGLAQTAALMAMGVPAVFFLVDAFVIFCIARGRNWARILRLLFTAASVATTVLHPSPASSELVRAAEDISLALDLVALAFLFLTPGRLWFSRAAATPAG